MSPARAWVAGFLAAERLPAAYETVIDHVAAPLAEWAASQAVSGITFRLGLCGPQASGKSTLTAVLARLLTERGLTVAVLSLDDLYLSRSARSELATAVHPLLRTRGPPGTHDLDLGHAVFDQFQQSGPVPLPRFSKAQDDPVPRADWPTVQGPVDVVLFEGWCVGAQAQSPEALLPPVNRLEAEEDPDGVWRGYVNRQLAGAYQGFFSRLDRLIYLRPPSFEVVLSWREEQEAKLRRRLAQTGASAGQVMDAPAVARFIQHYERLTRAMMADLPTRADLTLQLDAARRIEPFSLPR